MLHKSAAPVPFYLHSLQTQELQTTDSFACEYHLQGRVLLSCECEDQEKRERV